MLEYDSQPPFDTGSTNKAPVPLLEEFNLMIEEFAKKD